MKSRIKILMSKKWLCNDDAVGLLAYLTESKVDNADFIGLVNHQGVDFYVDSYKLIYNYKCGYEVARGLAVTTTDGETATILNNEMVRVVSPQLSETFSPHGNRLVLDCAEYSGKFEGWSDEALLVQWPAAPDCVNNLGKLGLAIDAQFRVSDIQALADVINGSLSIMSHCDADALKVRIAELEGENAKLRAANASNAADGIVFPYSTPELEVMRDLAIQYWVGYNPVTDKKPQQKDVGIELTTRMRWSLSSGGTASRQASPLATAIQPKEYRERK